MTRTSTLRALLLVGLTLGGCVRPPAAPEEAPEPIDPAVAEDARQRGVAFRAVGNEPGWVLEIVPERSLRLLYAYGEEEATTPVPEPVTDATGRTTYHAVTEAHDLRVVVEDRPCADTMSGERFEATVTVTLGGDTLRGCGGALR